MAAENPLAAATSASPALARRLGLLDTTMVVMGAIIGMGIFVYSASAARDLPVPSLLLVAWAIGGVGALTGALTFAELGGLLPRAGGPYVFLVEAFGRFVGFLYGWAMFFVVTTGAIGGLAKAFASQLAPMLSLGPVGQKVVAAGAILFVSGVNYVGVKPGAWVQNVLTFAKIAALLLVIGGAFLVPSSATSFAHFQTPEDAAVPNGVVGALAGAIVFIMFCYGGWQVSTNLAAEVRDVERTLPRAIIMGTIGVVALYLLANAAYLYCLPIDQIAQSKDRLATEAVRTVLGEFGARAVTAGILCSLLGALNAYVMVMPRVYYAMARDGLFLRSMARVSPRFQTPGVAVVLQGAWACFLVVGFLEELDEFANYVVAIDWIFFTLAGISLFALRFKLPDAARPYRVPLYPWVPLVFAVFGAAVTVSTFARDTVTALKGFTILLIGIPFYVYWASKSRARASPRALRA